MKIKHQFKVHSKNEKKKKEIKPCADFNESHGKHINDELKPVLTQPEELCSPAELQSANEDAGKRAGA